MHRELHRGVVCLEPYHASKTTTLRGLGGVPDGHGDLLSTLGADSMLPQPESRHHHQDGQGSPQNRWSTTLSGTGN